MSDCAALIASQKSHRANKQTNKQQWTQTLQLGLWISFGGNHEKQKKTPKNGFWKTTNAPITSCVSSHPVGGELVARGPLSVHIYHNDRANARSLPAAVCLAARSEYRFSGRRPVFPDGLSLLTWWEKFRPSSHRASKLVGTWFLSTLVTQSGPVPKYQYLRVSESVSKSPTKKNITYSWTNMRTNTWMLNREKMHNNMVVVST